jgi:hypothetical protein
MAVTLDQVQMLVAQLNEYDQALLVEHIEERLARSVSAALAKYTGEPWDNLFRALDAVSASPLLYPNASATREVALSRR